MRDSLGGRRDFFISFNQADRGWATWIAWALEEAGYSVWFQDWDFRGNFVEHMNRAHIQAHRTLAVLSDHYFGSGFTLAEWSARFAQDPAAREDRLVPVKVGPLTDDGILRPILYADLTDCDEDEAQRRLIDRAKKAIDAAYRAKPKVRPGFPGGGQPAREVPRKPEFPPPEAKPGASWSEQGSLMTGSKTVSIGRDAVGNVITVGDNNQITARVEAKLAKTLLPPAGSVDIGRELAAIRAILERIGGEQAGRIGRALDDAEEETRKPQPDKDEIGAALSRALDYAKKGSGFAEEVAKLAPHVANATAWLGSNWHKLLPIVGLVGLSI